MNTKHAMLFSFLMVLVSLTGYSVEPQPTDTVIKLESSSGFYQLNSWYLGGQPNLADINWFHDQNVEMVINLRSEKEIEDYTRYAFDEDSVIQSLGMKYVSIPVGGFTSEKLDTFAEHINNTDGKIMIHCARAGRVTHFIMAYLIKYRQFTINEAVNIGKQITFSLPIEKLLDQEINMSLK
ncbi:MAG: hypothetical protein GVY19_08970 [Bacteroidetes bacterium]|jgi:protein tyrosine phosphatase (PTP) superfamily phosphohydrolase (DUF442 family)|nr:hypothetical protein [Bacteroidota bacterium]